jgi:hypothetical protein
MKKKANLEWRSPIRKTFIGDIQPDKIVDGSEKTYNFTNELS